MKLSNPWIIAVLISAGLPLAACAKKSDTTAEVKPATVEHIEGEEVSRVVLTLRAAERLGIMTAPVGEHAGESKFAVSPPTAELAQDDAPASPESPTIGGGQRKIVPYSAVLYDEHGNTWVYTSPEPLTFIREPVSVAYISGDSAILSDGPPIGTGVVTVGVAELLGTEYKIGH